MNPTLSFCIPTRNRAAYLAESLESIRAQATGAVEIVVVDGASTDGTGQVVQAFSGRFPRIRYFRREESTGVDRDILKAVELAQGDYCWLMSDDDRLEDGAVGKALAALARHQGIAGISVNTKAYDSRMRYQIRAVPAAGRGRLSADHLFGDREQCFSVLGVHFGYLSAQIVNRRLWGAAVSAADVAPYFNCWIVPYVIGQMLRLEPRWLYLHGRLVGYRSGNDSFAARLGVYNRQVVAHVDFEKVVRDLFGKGSAVYDEVFATLLSDRMARSLAVLKAGGASLPLQGRLFALYTRQYRTFPLYWLKVVPVFLVPNFILKAVRAAYFWARARQGSGSRRPAAATASQPREQSCI